MASVLDVQFEHYHAPNTIGLHEKAPRISWKIESPVGSPFEQDGYEIELTRYQGKSQHTTSIQRVESPLPRLTQWPFPDSLTSRERISVRVRVWDKEPQTTPWSLPAHLETGLLNREDWACKRIAAPWGPDTVEPGPEELYRRSFAVEGDIDEARLYITAQGVYEAEMNGSRVGDHFMAPGWTSYDGRLQYQTYDVTPSLVSGDNCIGVRVAEGWFSGRIGFEGGHRNIWGPHNALLAQLEILYTDGRRQTIISDASWTVSKGPIRLAQIYDGESYDATREIPLWSNPTMPMDSPGWSPVCVMSDLPDTIELTAGFGEPVRRVEVVKALQHLTSPSGKTIIDFGQNLVGYVRLKNIRGRRGQKITLRHAEVLEQGELSIRPLRICKALDEYIIGSDTELESYEPRFTFHGFRYAQIDNWPGDFELENVEAVVCHTDMKLVGQFACSDSLLNKLYQNIVWGMRGNFLSVPTDCPQRDERLGWSGDLALFAPTAGLIYDCFGMLRNWLIDVEFDQHVLGGVPPMVSPNATLPDPIWCRRVPCAIWHDVTILAPWALYQETGDKAILSQQYNSMITWMNVLPKGQEEMKHLWDPSVFQLGDWLDPAAPADEPWKSTTNAKMVANMFLIQSLDLMVKISGILEKWPDQQRFKAEAAAARSEFQDEYVTKNGLVASESQAAYALAICFDLLKPAQRKRAATRLVELVRKNRFKIATGFAGTPYICEALASTGHLQIAYSMLLEKDCPSWLYPVTMGATTVWERWDSMLPDGSINPGEMTSFNHYAFGAIAKFLYERVAGLQRTEPGWKACRIAPSIGARFSSASASHLTPNGRLSISWETSPIEGNTTTISIQVEVPPKTTAEVIIPSKEGEKREEVGAGSWSFTSTFERDYEWPVLPLKPKS
ncbi:unnamed protein product [Clonostachys rosea f. rosea IK726]|uniref:alpha-L-rhamnosidase n=2 Tax=Bionectria ochroleuca TaxID=29856 RepID=A0A0B7KCX4_BIOOC|nr:unnamed protein product [Clonostachys rosea f. rosea IK726]